VQAPPTSAAIIEQYESLLAGRISRDEAGRWAAQWVTSADPPKMSSVAWAALSRLYDCDRRHGHGDWHVHSDEQIFSWLRELEVAVAGSQGEPPNTSLERTREG
jgi:hypothetical protein